MKEIIKDKKREALNIVNSTIESCKKLYWEFTEAFNIFKPVPFKGDRKIPLSSDGEKLYFSPEKVMEDYARDQYESLSHELIHVLLHMIFGDPEEYRNTTSKNLHNAYTDTRLDILQYYLEVPEETREKDMCFRFDPNPAMLYYCFFRSFIDGTDKLSDSFFELKKNKYLCKKLISSQKNIRSFYERDDHELWLKPQSRAVSIKWMKVREGLGLTAGEETDFKGQGNKSIKVYKKADKGTGAGANGDNWEDLAKLFDEGSRVRSENYGYGYGSRSGSNSDIYKACKEKGKDYTEIIRDFFRETEGQREDPEAIDRMMYSYGFELYDDVALIEPSEDTEKKKIGTIAVAIDTSGSCSGPIAGRFLREISNIFRDISRAGEFEQIIFYQCDCKIQQKKVFTDPGDIDLENEEVELYGFGGTSFIPVFEDLDEMMKEERKEVDALFYLTDGYGDYPEKEAPYKTFFIIPEDCINHYGFELPDWITGLSIKGQILW